MLFLYHCFIQGGFYYLILLLNFLLQSPFHVECFEVQFHFIKIILIVIIAVIIKIKIIIIANYFETFKIIIDWVC